MNHSIRTPLNAVIGAASLLAAEDFDGELRTAVETIESSGHALTSLLKEALDLDSFQAGSAQPQSVAFQPLALIERCAQLIEPLARRKGVAVHRECSPELEGVSLSGDPVRLQQVLTNLLSNAVKFCDRGWIRIVALSKRGPGAQATAIHFEVADSGIGMGEEARRSLFKRFEQAHRQTLTGPTGTGLGLAISQRFVEMMGGRLDCESEPGKGSRFFFTLSLLGIREEARQPQTLRAPVGLRVLVAEDNVVNQRVLRGMLERLNCEVRVVGDGAQAVKTCLEERFDIVFMDCDMPVLSGIEAARSIRGVAGLSDLPIIAVTAHSLASNLESCMEAGMSAVLTKPVSLDQLSQALFGWGSSDRADRRMTAHPSESGT
jgi:two-component system, sensor histidine kinase and response regulator